MFGERIRIFSHTKKVSMYNVKCSLGECSERFIAKKTIVIGATKFNEFNLMFMKKPNQFGKKVSITFVLNISRPTLIQNNHLNNSYIYSNTADIFNSIPSYVFFICVIFAKQFVLAGSHVGSTSLSR